MSLLGSAPYPRKCLCTPQERGKPHGSPIPQYGAGQLWDPPGHTTSQELQQSDVSDGVTVLFKKLTDKMNKNMGDIQGETDPWMSHK